MFELRHMFYSKRRFASFTADHTRSHDGSVVRSSHSAMSDVMP